MILRQEAGIRRHLKEPDTLINSPAAVQSIAQLGISKSVVVRICIIYDVAIYKGTEKVRSRKLPPKILGTQHPKNPEPVPMKERNMGMRPT